LDTPKDAKNINSKIKVFPMSIKKGTGIEKFVNFLMEEYEKKNE